MDAVSNAFCVRDEVNQGRSAILRFLEFCDGRHLFARAYYRQDRKRPI